MLPLKPEYWSTSIKISLDAFELSLQELIVENETR